MKWNKLWNDIRNLRKILDFTIENGVTINIGNNKNIMSNENNEVITKSRNTNKKKLYIKCVNWKNN